MTGIVATGLCILLFAIVGIALKRSAEREERLHEPARTDSDRLDQLEARLKSLEESL